MGHVRRIKWWPEGVKAVRVLGVKQEPSQAGYSSQALVGSREMEAELHPFLLSLNTFFKKINLFIYFWLCWVFVAAFSSCSEQGLPFIAVHGLLTAVASLVAEHGL